MPFGSHMAYSVFIHNVTYIYYAITSRVKCVACAKLLVAIVLLLLELSVGVGWGWGIFCPLVLLYVSAFCLWDGCISFSAIVKSDIFIFCCDSLSIVSCVHFVKLYYLQFCKVVAGFLGVVEGWVGLLYLCSLPFLRG